MPLFQGFRPVTGAICPSRAAAVVGPSRAPQGIKKGRRPRRRPRLKLSDKAGPDQCPVPGENALFPAQIAGFLAVSRPVPVYPVFLKYVVSVHFSCKELSFALFRQHSTKWTDFSRKMTISRRLHTQKCRKVTDVLFHRYPFSDWSSIIFHLIFCYSLLLNSINVVFF